MKKIFLVLSLFFPLFCSAQEDNIYCRKIEINTVETPQINDGAYTDNYWDITISGPVEIICELYANSHIDYIDMYKSDIGAYSSSTYLPDSIKIYWSEDNVNYTLINSYNSLNKTNNEHLKYNIITTQKYRWYKVELYDCNTTWVNNECAISEIEFINKEDVEHLMTEDTLSNVLRWETGMVIMIWVLLFFLWLWKLSKRLWFY